MEEKELKKELAKLKREAIEFAGAIHDIVEDRLWTDYNDLLELSKKVADACKKVEAFQKEHNL